MTVHTLHFTSVLSVVLGTGTTYLWLGNPFIASADMYLHDNYFVFRPFALIGPVGLALAVSGIALIGNRWWLSRLNLILSGSAVIMAIGILLSIGRYYAMLEHFGRLGGQVSFPMAQHMRPILVNAIAVLCVSVALLVFSWRLNALPADTHTEGQSGAA